MIVKHIYHSAVEIISEKYQIIIDYFEGPLKLREDRETIFLVSHGHEDHYSSKIHDYHKKVILYSGMDYRDENTLALAPGEELNYKDLLIRTSGSTDQGLSFGIELEGRRIIHAGDLNNWIWPEDSPEERALMERDFLNYLSHFKKEPDLLCFPLDYRLKENYSLGAMQAIGLLKPKYFLPLHFKEHPEILPLFKKLASNKTQVILPEETPFSF